MGMVGRKMHLSLEFIRYLWIYILKGPVSWHQKAHSRKFWLSFAVGYGFIFGALTYFNILIVLEFPSGAHLEEPSKLIQFMFIIGSFIGIFFIIAVLGLIDYILLRIILKYEINLMESFLNRFFFPFFLYLLPPILMPLAIIYESWVATSEDRLFKVEPATQAIFLVLFLSIVITLLARDSIHIYRSSKTNRIKIILFIFIIAISIFGYKIYSAPLIPRPATEIQSVAEAAAISRANMKSEICRIALFSKAQKEKETRDNYTEEVLKKEKYRKKYGIKNHDTFYEAKKKILDKLTKYDEEADLFRQLQLFARIYADERCEPSFDGFSYLHTQIHPIYMRACRAIKLCSPIKKW